MAIIQPIDIISRALRSIGALASGEVPDANQGTDGLALLNEMLDQWSNDHMLVFAQQDIFHQLVGGTFIYTIGPGGSVGAAFTGSISGTVLTVTALASGSLSSGQLLTGAGITSGTAITSLGTATGGSGIGAIGTYNLNLSNSVGSISITSNPPRPLRINSAIVRVVNSITGTLDYPVAVLAYEEYQLIGIKTLPGPWPRALYYQPTEPLGIINYWPNPGTGEMHLYCDTVLNQFSTLNDTVTLPQGYIGAMHWSLAELLMPEYGKTDPAQIEMVMKQAAKGRVLVKNNNRQPQMPARYDDAIQAKTRADAGFILTGGFN